MHQTEVEIRSFVDEKDFARLQDFFDANATFLKEDNQETTYLDVEEDIRYMRSDHYARVWKKSGKIHDDVREEVVIDFGKEEYQNIEKLFEMLGYKTKIKWFRKRRKYQWGDINVFLDYTKGYGYIIELEIICTKDTSKKMYNLLVEKMAVIGVPVTPKSVFEDKFVNYQKNWKRLI